MVLVVKPIGCNEFAYSSCCLCAARGLNQSAFTKFAFYSYMYYFGPSTVHHISAIFVRFASVKKPVSVVGAAHNS